VLLLQLPFGGIVAGFRWSSQGGFGGLCSGCKCAWFIWIECVCSGCCTLGSVYSLVNKIPSYRIVSASGRNSEMAATRDLDVLTPPQISLSLHIFPSSVCIFDPYGEIIRSDHASAGLSNPDTPDFTALDDTCRSRISRDPGGKSNR
jgi:hypothetical protein